MAKQDNLDKRVAQIEMLLSEMPDRIAEKMVIALKGIYQEITSEKARTLEQGMKKINRSPL